MFDFFCSSLNRALNYDIYIYILKKTKWFRTQVTMTVFII